MNEFPEIGFLSLTQIIGQQAVTEKEAAANRKRDKGPKRPRAATPAIVPVKKSCWWDGVKSGRFPKPVKIGDGRGTFWRVEDIKKLVASV